MFGVQHLQACSRNLQFKAPKVSLAERKTWDIWRPIFAGFQDNIDIYTYNILVYIYTCIHCVYTYIVCAWIYTLHVYSHDTNMHMVHICISYTYSTNMYIHLHKYICTSSVYTYIYIYIYAIYVDAYTWIYMIKSGTAWYRYMPSRVAARLESLFG